MPNTKPIHRPTRHDRSPPPAPDERPNDGAGFRPGLAVVRLDVSVDAGEVVGSAGGEVAAFVAGLAWLGFAGGALVVERAGVGHGFGSCV